MFESKKTPGKKFGNGFQAKRYDEMHGKGGEAETAVHESKETPEFEAGEHEGMNEGGADHGPATEVHIYHDHENKKHHVHTTHKDGHKHMSEHQTPEEAHEEGGKLAGISVKKENEQNGEEDDQQGAKSEEDGFEMPPLV
jgi:hypothetical protein